MNNLTELLTKLRSNESRDALASNFNWSGIVNRLRTAKTAYKAGYDARSKDLELVIKCLEFYQKEMGRVKIAAKAQGFMFAHDWIDEADKELEVILLSTDNDEMLISIDNNNGERTEL